ncbi:hypothetical protein FS593_11745 [Lelliottia amnigena]|nr:hypothetical protein FS593_11745 [Lelliottia amnigena]
MTGSYIAAPLTIPAPGKKIAASRCSQLFPSTFRVGRDPASLQVAPSPRFPARRPGLTETLRRFTAGPEGTAFRSNSRYNL